MSTAHEDRWAREVAAERATRVLVYYLRTAWERAGLKWERDNESEVRGIVTDIVTAAQP